MTRDTFFEESTCFRCHGKLGVRTMSWFNEDTICMVCHDKEQVVKAKLREQGIEDAMEGCGFIPNPDNYI